jgi:hypothetical protein
MENIGVALVALTSGKLDQADEWVPPPEVQRLVIEAGYRPDEIREEILAWHEPRVMLVSDAA